MCKFDSIRDHELPLAGGKFSEYGISDYLQVNLRRTNSIQTCCDRLQRVLIRTGALAGAGGDRWCGLLQLRCSGQGRQGRAVGLGLRPRPHRLLPRP